ncbi:MAG: hypothetical protein AAF664_18910, partial [Planctomycetota bacterium]
DTRIQIRNGNALNWFLAALGSIALDHELTIDRVESELADAKKDLDALNDSVPVTTADRERREEAIQLLRNRITQLTEYRRIVTQEVGGRQLLRPEDMSRLRFRVGEVGGKQKYVMENSENSALPLRWPTIIASDPIYKKHREAVTAGRDLAITEIKQEGAISPETQNYLMETIDALNKELDEDFSVYCKTEKNVAIRNHQFMHALNFAEGLQSSLYLFLQAERLSDVAVSERFEGNRIEQLIAYMTRNGYQFDRADPVVEPVHRRIYNEMVEYYVSVKALEVSASNAAEEEGRWNQRLQSTYARLDRQLTNDLKDVAIAFAPKGPSGIQSFFDFLDNANTAVETIENAKKIRDWLTN